MTTNELTELAKSRYKWSIQEIVSLGVFLLLPLGLTIALFQDAVQLGTAYLVFSFSGFIAALLLWIIGYQKKNKTELTAFLDEGHLLITGGSQKFGATNTVRLPDVKEVSYSEDTDTFYLTTNSTKQSLLSDEEADERQSIAIPARMFGEPPLRRVVMSVIDEGKGIRVSKSARKQFDLYEKIEPLN